MAGRCLRHAFSLRARSGTLALCFILGAAGASAAETSALDFANIKRKACAPFQQQYDQAVAAAGQDPVLAEYQKQLDAADAAANAILQDLASHRAANVARMTATVGPTASADSVPTRRGAAKIYEESLPQFGRRLPLPRLGPEQQSALRDYHSACVGALERCITRYAVDRAMPGASDAEVLEIQRLCMVLPLLVSPEDAWSAKDIEAFPDWMKSLSVLDALEEFALRLRRPVTGFQLFRFGQTSEAAGRPDDAEFAEYLRTAADTMLRSRDYDAAKYYLAQAADLAGSPREKADARLRLAEVLGDVGDPKAAAKELGKVLGESSDGDTYGRAAMLRLKYLYEAKAFGDVLAAVPAHQQDPRCEPYLPQILYITWVASRQQNAPAGESERWQKAFLDRYPDHSLGADMYFASAMGLLAESRYDEARKVLKYVEIHYPKSKVAGKAREIAQRLQSVTTRPTRG